MTTRRWLDNMLLNLNLTTTLTVVHYGIYLEHWAAPGQPPRMNTFYIRSKQVTIQTFRNTTAILQYMYITYCISNKMLMFYLLRDIKAASQYCNDNVTYERENTTQFAQYLYHTVLRAKMIGITRLYDVFTQLVT